MADTDEDDEDLRASHVRVAGLGLLPQTRPALDASADAIASAWLVEHRVAIKKLSEARQSLYAEITAMSTDPQLMPIALPKVRQEETKRWLGDGPQLVDTRPLHLLANDEGNFPIGKLNPDEVAVLDAERARDDFLAWYRNPTGGRDSLSIAYQDTRSEWRTLRPDFIFFNGDETTAHASIVDPHGAWLPDSLSKLRGMARFAETYGTHFHRIESISRIDGQLRVLDFTDSTVRQAVLTAQDADSAYRASSVAY